MIRYYDKSAIIILQKILLDLKNFKFKSIFLDHKDLLSYLMLIKVKDF